MGTVVFTSPRTLRVLGLQKLLFPFIFRRNVPLLLITMPNFLVQFLSLLTFYIIFLQIMLQCCSRERFLVQIASNRFLCKTYRTQSYTQEDLQFCINPLFACNRIEFIKCQCLFWERNKLFTNTKGYDAT